MQLDSMRRYEGELCCCRCDAAMLGLEEPKAQAARVAPTEKIVMQRAAPARLSAIVGANQLACRFCAKAQPTSGTSRFRVMRAPLDSGGRNGLLPPPLRLVAFCPAHSRPWLEGALVSMPLGQIFAHIAERAVPVFGAEHGRRAALSLTMKPPISKPKGQTKARREFLKRLPRGVR